MKKQKLKNLLKCGILLFGISLIFTNCQKDDIQFNEEKTSFLKGLSHRSFSSIKDIPIVNQKTSRFIKAKNEFNRINADSITFTIDTTAVQVIESDAYISYTFKANMFNEVENKLHNYVLTLFNDETVNQLLVTYPILEDNNDLIYDFNNTTAEAIDGDILLYARGDGCQGLYDVDTWNPNGGTCIDYDCTAGGNHSPGDNCNGDENEQPYTICTGAWVSHCASGSGNGGNTGTDEDDFQLGGGGSTNSPNDQEDEEPIAVVPYDETFGLRRECNKITNYLDNNTINFRQQLVLLAATVNENYENSIAVSSDNSQLVQSGTVGSGGTNIPTNPTLQYATIAHTHDAFGLDPDGDGVGTGTYSVFSFEDLKTLAEILYNNKLNSGTFVAFLTTNKGTRYALTINNSTKFLDLFYSVNENNPTTEVEKTKWQNSYSKLSDLKWEYYNPKNTDCKIKTTDNDNETVLEHFLSFLEQGDAGVTIFEANTTFDSFDRVKLTDLGVKRLPCNN